MYPNLRGGDALAAAQQAVESKRRLAAAQPDAFLAELALTLSNLGVALRSQGKAEEGLADCNKALRLRPDYADAHCNLSTALRDLGRPAEAAASCREALRLRPSYPEAHLNLGNALRELGRPAEATASYREALRLRPEFSLKWLPKLRHFRRPLIALQDGMQPQDIMDVLRSYSSAGLFLGGRTEWKLREMYSWGMLACACRRYYHIGRVNTARRIRLAAEAGADSFDGTSASRYSVTVPLLDAARAHPSLLVPATFAV